MSQGFLFAGISFSQAAYDNIQEVGLSEVSVTRDVRELRARRESKASLLSLCLEGADDDRKQGWHDYVDAVADAANAAITRGSGTCA